MKRIFSVLLALVLIVTAFAACSKKGNVGQAYSYTASTVSKSQIYEYAKQGVMTPIVYTDLGNDTAELEISAKLGMKRSELVELLGEDQLVTTRSGNYKKISTSAAYYYFNAQQQDNGVVAIVCLDSIYGFGISTTTVEQVRQKMGEDGVKDEAKGDEISFLPYSAGVTADRLTYTCGNNTLEFYFISGGLSATILSMTGEW